MQNSGRGENCGHFSFAVMIRGERVLFVSFGNTFSLAARAHTFVAPDKSMSPCGLSRYGTITYIQKELFSTYFPIIKIEKINALYICEAWVAT